MRFRVMPALMLALLPVTVVSAQELQRGAVLDKVVCVGDPGQSYALYLPSGYSPSRQWPILYAFDAGARGLLAVQRFKDAAERFGFILAGSNNSRNGPLELSRDAMNAMARDTQRRFALDRGRVYTAGFSGGARVAAMVGLAPGMRVAGVIGFGAGFPSDTAPSAPLPFAFFGAAGTDDFNYPELRRLDQALERIGARRRLEVFAGGHDWPPEAVCAHALEWMQLQSMRSGGLAPNDALLDEILARGMAEAAGDEGAGRAHEAYQRYAALAKDFAGLRDVSACERKSSELARAREVRRAREDLTNSVDRQAVLEREVTQLAHEARAGQADAGADLLARLTDTRKQADAARQSAERMAARRILAVFWPRFGRTAADDMAGGAYAQAAVCYRAMTRIRPDDAEVEYLACACARSGNRKEAVGALRRAVGKGFADAGRVGSDPALDALRSDPAFRQIVEALARKVPTKELDVIRERSFFVRPFV